MDRKRSTSFDSHCSPEIIKEKPVAAKADASDSCLPCSAASTPATPFCPSSSSFQKSVLLFDWWLVKVENEGEEVKLSVSGLSSRGQHAARAFSSAPIVKRYDSYTVMTADGMIVMIQGVINKERMKENGFPEEFCQRFFTGFPFNWNVYAEEIFTKKSPSESLMLTVNVSEEPVGVSANTVGQSLSRLFDGFKSHFRSVWSSETADNPNEFCRQISSGLDHKMKTCSSQKSSEISDRKDAEVRIHEPLIVRDSIDNGISNSTNLNGTSLVDDNVEGKSGSISYTITNSDVGGISTEVASFEQSSGAHEDDSDLLEEKHVTDDSEDCNMDSSMNFPIITDIGTEALFSLEASSDYNESPDRQETNKTSNTDVDPNADNSKAPHVINSGIPEESFLDGIVASCLGFVEKNIDASETLLFPEVSSTKTGFPLDMDSDPASKGVSEICYSKVVCNTERQTNSCSKEIPTSEYVAGNTSFGNKFSTVARKLLDFTFVASRVRSSKRLRKNSGEISEANPVFMSSIDKKKKKEETKTCVSAVEVSKRILNSCEEAEKLKAKDKGGRLKNKQQGSAAKSSLELEVDFPMTISNESGRYALRSRSCNSPNLIKADVQKNEPLAKGIPISRKKSSNKKHENDTRSSAILPESLNLRRSKSGRLLVPALAYWVQDVIYDADGTITGITGVDTPERHTVGTKRNSRKRHPRSANTTDQDDDIRQPKSARRHVAGQREQGSDDPVKKIEGADFETTKTPIQRSHLESSKPQGNTITGSKDGQVLKTPRTGSRTQPSRKSKRVVHYK